MKDLAAIILIGLLLGAVAVAENENRRDEAPLVHAAWSQPRGRIFAVCPNDARNYDKSKGRSA